MPQSPPPTKKPVPTPENEQPLLDGYIRSHATHIGCEWSFEVLSEQPPIAIVTIQTDDGPLDVGLNQEAAMSLLQKLQLFLQDWPDDQAKS